MTFRGAGAGRAIFIVLATFACLAGCTTAPDDSRFAIDFHQTWTQQPGICHTGELYCYDTIMATSDFSGTLDVSGNSATITIGITKWAAPYMSVNYQNNQIPFQNSGTCDFYYVKMSDTGTELVGTWTEQFSCHGQTRGGTLVGHRS